MPVREFVAAGPFRFYPDSPEECRREVESYLASPEADRRADIGLEDIRGGIVPHAGWVFSGAVAAEVLQILAAGRDIETFVVFGAVHQLVSRAAGSVYASGSWRMPMGEVAIDESLAAAVLDASPILSFDVNAHDSEHAIEVQVPFIQHLVPSARLLPVSVPPTPAAPDVGRIVAEQVDAIGRRVVFIGSTDLTHYGPRYRFTPMGVGPEALKWAKDVNDRRILDLIVELRAEEIIAEAIEHHNACGAGAVAATIQACRAAGCDAAQVIRHTTSSEVARDRLADSPDAVGYAGVVFGRSAR